MGIIKRWAFYGLCTYVSSDNCPPPYPHWYLLYIEFDPSFFVFEFADSFLIAHSCPEYRHLTFYIIAARWHTSGIWITSGAYNSLIEIVCFLTFLHQLLCWVVYPFDHEDENNSDDSDSDGFDILRYPAYYDVLHCPRFHYSTFATAEGWWLHIWSPEGSEDLAKSLCLNCFSTYVAWEIVWGTICSCYLSHWKEVTVGKWNKVMYQLIGLWTSGSGSNHLDLYLLVCQSSCCHLPLPLTLLLLCVGEGCSWGYVCGRWKLSSMPRSTWKLSQIIHVIHLWIWIKISWWTCSKASVSEQFEAVFPYPGKKDVKMKSLLLSLSNSPLWWERWQYWVMNM